MIQWEFGLYTMLAIATTITMGILAARLFYVDGLYAKIVKVHTKYADMWKEPVLTPEANTDPDVEQADMVEYLLQEQHETIRYTNYKNNNRNLGAIIDMAAILSFVVMGMALVIGPGRDSAAVLAVFACTILAIPPLHFIYHLNIIRKSRLSTSDLT